MVRFGIISDPHIALPETLPEPSRRFPLVEFSIPAFEVALADLTQLGIDFLLLPGDLTQHGEPENHRWLGERLQKLPFPTYVIPGNHDLPVPEPDGRSIGFAEFPLFYPQAGYVDPHQHYYCCYPAPGLRLIALNSNTFNDQGKQIGYLESAQWAWLEEILGNSVPEPTLTMVMIHHNVIPHLPDQAEHILSRRYILANAAPLRQLLKQHQVPLLITGHLHVQNIAYAEGLYEITTGSLASYPHPYRRVEIPQLDALEPEVKITTHYVQAVPTAPDLQAHSRQWLVNRSLGFMAWYLTLPPLSLDQVQADRLAPQLQEVWAQVSAGDARVELPDLPQPVRAYFENFSHVSPTGCPELRDNNTQFRLQARSLAASKVDPHGLR
ncbi:metallophosphoesterase [Thermosynechococcaceae cyanobacterium BACA0444]|uniref:Metallophosphoesterase n=1 Tax=Pseudocalidococcus azoricus BACA0444 TaxID=2918990 RepID=A0AAE4JZB6_9CYAN|nr:metallophosphoesterase [Pseudocalidococcus azoricus]MDS3860637.1 metallophosphoesterase [Pseudocalidococcus azoricus BACA0444]